MAAKVAAGNSQSSWLARLAQHALSSSVHFWVENPHSSWLWRQRPWMRLARDARLGAFITDQCAWGMAWRKRTRFLTTTGLGGQRATCPGCLRHVHLRGRSGTLH